MTRNVPLLLTATLLVAACSQRTEPQAEGNAATLPANRSSAVAPAAAAPNPPTPALTLAGDGLGTGLKFGDTERSSVAVASKALGEPSGRSRNDECGEGPMTFASYRDLQLGFQEGKLVGWSLRGKSPALRTAGGIAIGTTRGQLGKIAIDEQSSLGPEFSVADVGGVLGEDGKVAALWAGNSCQFR